MNETTQTTQTTKKSNSILNIFKVLAEVLLVIGFIVFEELIWKKAVVPFKEWIAGFKIIAKAQAWIEQQNTISTLVFFLAPFVLAEALGIWSTGQLVVGNIGFAVFLYALKIPVAGGAFWVFSFSKEKLLTLDWFKTAYELIIKGFDWVKATKIYGKVQARIIKIKEYIANLKGEGDGIGSRFTNIYKELKKLFDKK